MVAKISKLKYKGKPRQRQPKPPKSGLITTPPSQFQSNSFNDRHKDLEVKKNASQNDVDSF